MTGLLHRSTLRLDALAGLAHVLLRRADDGPSSGRGERRLKRAIRETVDEFLRTTQWTVRVPGTHSPSGLSNDELFDVRAKEGRDFLQRTVQLDQNVRPKLRALFAQWRREPTLAELREAYSDLVIEFMVLRFEAGGGDILLTPLSPAYAKEKAAAGYGGEPIGVATGEHRDALRDNGRLEFSA